MTYAFLGGAGTGKTHRLVEAATGFHEKTGVGPGQKVLGLTFMHGSRHRMDGRLAAQPPGGPRFRVATFDSFALEVVRRCRRHCSLTGGEVRTDIAREDPEWVRERGIWRGGLSCVRHQAAELLGRSEVRATIKASYPLVLIDEVQDCDDELLPIITQLADTTLLVCAGDPFQALNHSGPSPAIEWLKDHAEVRALERQHRTSDPAILSSADALRAGHTVVGPRVEVLEIPAYGLAAYEIQKRLVWGEWEGSAALIPNPASPRDSGAIRS